MHLTGVPLTEFRQCTRPHSTLMIMFIFSVGGALALLPRRNRLRKEPTAPRHAAAVRPHGRMRLPTDSCPRVGLYVRVSGNSFNGNHPTEKGLRNFGTKIQTGLEAYELSVYRSADKSSIAVPLTCFSISL